MRAEAKFHYVVRRPLLRESSSSWKRATVDESLIIPTEMAAWVVSGTDSNDFSGEVVTTTSEESAAMEPAQT